MSEWTFKEIQDRWPEGVKIPEAERKALADALNQFHRPFTKALKILSGIPLDPVVKEAAMWLVEDAYNKAGARVIHLRLLLNTRYNE